MKSLAVNAGLGHNDVSVQILKVAIYFRERFSPQTPG